MRGDDGRPAMIAAAATFVVGLLVAPLVYHHYDVIDCFLPWARATAGRAPWEVYSPRFRTPCDYPPVVPYLLTLVEAARRALGATESGALAVVLLKLPNLLAAAAHAPLAFFGLRGPLGAPAAAAAAWLGALSPALFVNAALWGQFDAVLSLLVVASVVAVLHGRPVAAGALLGAALATKLLAVVAIPVLLPWAWRRLGPAAVLRGLGAAVAVIVLAAVPMVLGGAGDAVLAAYMGAVGYYPLRTVEAYNVWYLADRVDIFLRGLPAREARLDTRTIVDGLTHRHLGLAALAVAVVVSLRRSWREADAGPRAAAALPVLLALLFFAFFMLPTQMHQRYVLPVATLAALAAGASRPALLFAVALAATATLNQGLDLARAVLDQAVIADPGAVPDPGRWRGLLRAGATVVALVHVGLFAWAFLRGPRLLRPGLASGPSPAVR